MRRGKREREREGEGEKERGREREREGERERWMERGRDSRISAILTGIEIGKKV